MMLHKEHFRVERHRSKDIQNMTESDLHLQIKQQKLDAKVTFKSDFLSPHAVACVGVQTSVHPCVSHKQHFWCVCVCVYGGAGGILLMLRRIRLQIMAFKDCFSALYCRSLMLTCTLLD